MAKWTWIRGPGQPGHGSHSRRLKYAGDAQTPEGVDLYLPAGHRWETLSSPDRGDRSYGTWVFAREVCHANVELLFAHLSVEKLGIGKRYEGGTKLGETGNTGGSTGPHLHFETSDDFWKWADRIWTSGETKEWDEMATKKEIEAVVRKVVKEEAELYAEWAMAALSKVVLGRVMPTGFGGDLSPTYKAAIKEALAEAKERETAQHP